MNKQPISYLQTDARWGWKDYSTKGEKTTIRASGCGPTALSMVLATWVDKSITPETECAWALSHGYKALHSGTYYNYFVPAAKRFGLVCYRLNLNSIYGNANTAYHAQARDALERGDLVIACMGKGNWTSSGHYVLVWDVRGDTVYINDPASTKAHRVRGDYNLFRKQVKYYWVIARPETMKEDEDMDINKLLDEMTDEQAYTLMEKANRHANTLPEPVWSRTDGWWGKAAEAKTVDGTGPERYMKRDEFITVLGRLGLL